MARDGDSFLREVVGAAKGGPSDMLLMGDPFAGQQCEPARRRKERGGVGGKQQTRWKSNYEQGAVHATAQTDRGTHTHTVHQGQALTQRRGGEGGSKREQSWEVRL